MMSSNGTNQTGTSSRTVTQVEANPILRLRPAEESTKEQETTKTKTKTKKKKKQKAGVRWTDDVVDNENLNRKKSKICCIFHPQREFGESSSSDDSSDVSSDSSGDEQEKDTDKDACCDHAHHHKKSSKKQSKQAAGPNAYEKQPKYTNKSVPPVQE